jgi:hypothetical protein
MLVRSPSGEDIGWLDVIRRAAGWQTLAGLVDAAWDEYIWWDQAGRPLPVPIVGTRFDGPVTDVRREVLLGACVDIALGPRHRVRTAASRWDRGIALGPRPYGTAMR